MQWLYLYLCLYLCLSWCLCPWPHCYFMYHSNWILNFRCDFGCCCCAFKSAKTHRNSLFKCVVLWPAIVKCSRGFTTNTQMNTPTNKQKTRTEKEEINGGWFCCANARENVILCYFQYYLYSVGVNMVVTEPYICKQQFKDNVWYIGREFVWLLMC